MKIPRSPPFLFRDLMFMLEVIAANIPAFLRFSVSPLFPNGLEELIAAIVYFIFWYFEFINQAFVTIRNRHSIVQIKNDKLSLLGIYLGYFAMSYIAGWVATLRLTTHFGALPVWSFWVGVGVMLVGEGLREWSYYTLGRFFTAPVMIAKDHKLVIRGPYKFVRHPGYLAGVLTFAGLGLALQSWAAPIVIVIVLLITYYYRIHVEEQALRKKFGKAYDDYAKKTATIIPYVL